jgi:putative methyltransferase (TIGR04325 family)
MAKLKALIKELIPPLILKKVSNLFYGWSGNYTTWQDAQKKCTGYDSKNIIETVKTALLKVKNGEAIFERDSVIFDKVHYSYPLLSSLSLVALDKGSLNVLDFGGSLGSSYYQNRKLFSNLNQFSWSIVEQEHFVTEGKKTFSDDKLNFYYTIEECLKERKIDVLLLSSVLQYIEKPYELIDSLLTHNFEYIIVDRTPMLNEGADRITIQTVPKNIYQAKYPCWLLTENNVLKKLLSSYVLIGDEITNENINMNNAAYRFFFLKRKK